MAKNTKKTDKQEEIKDKEVVESVHEKETPSEEKNQMEQEEPAQKKTREDELEEKLADLQDKYLRLSAEYDNYRKRTLKEKIDMQEAVKEDVFVKILPVIDDLERALESIESAKEIEAVKQGMDLIYIKFTNFLNQQGVKEIDALGKELNTDQHEAVTKISVESKKKKGKVVDVIEKGYMLKERVIRFAKVVIGE
ncbi:MAG: nucleotide exchange factor GrpE [Bacteroidales bacterium]|nr:nucleotide exchange factor GrpE [Bacteroidales bacterium]